MFHKCYNNSSCEEENGTENWSYPSGFERFSSVNIPRSRLGKRRTLNKPPEVKVNINGSSSNKTEESAVNKINFRDIITKTPLSLTHPPNSFLTPHKKLGSLRKGGLIIEGSDSKNFELNGEVNKLTPFRKDLQPLQEVQNFLPEQNKNSSPEKPLVIPNSTLLTGSGDDIRKTLYKNFEVGKSNNSSEDYSLLNSFSTNKSETISDSSQSDLHNNSSFMTAHDISNFVKNRSCHEFPKTPGKGYSLFDFASPLDSVSVPTGSDDSVHRLLKKTPALGRYDGLHTPYRTQLKNDLYTPFKSNSRTPTSRARCLNDIPEQKTETQPRSRELVDDLQNRLSNDQKFKSDEKIPTDSDDSVHRLLSKTPSAFGRYDGLHTPYRTQLKNDFYTPFKDNSQTPASRVSCLNDIPEHKTETVEAQPGSTELVGDQENSLSNDQKCKSDEKMVRRQIFEGLGWSMPSRNSSEFLVPFSSSIQTSTGSSNSFSCNVESSLHSFSISEEPKKHDMPIQEDIISVTSFGSNFTYDNKTLQHDFEESSMNKQDLKLSLSPITIETNSPYNHNPVPSELKEDKGENTVVMCPIEQQTKEADSKTESNNTVILRQPTPEVTKKPEDNRPIDNNKVVKNDIKNNQQVLQNEAPLFAYQRQLMKPQVIYVNQKPYTVLSMLGRGGSSEVYQVLDTESSKLMALKFVNLSSVEDVVAEGYLNEVEVLSKLQGCQSVIKMFDNEYIQGSKILYVLMEKGDTDFSRLMKDIMKTKKISMPMIVYYWTEMLNAVKDIHEKGIIHSDLKPANFLLVAGRLKLIDFGIASSLQGDMTSVMKDVTTGTFNYMSPEAIRNCGETRGYKITYKSDIWSLGCILYNLLYGRTPFSHLTNTWTKLQAIADPDLEVSIPPNSSAPPHLLRSVRWALTKEPKKRPTAEELLKLAELTPGPETQLGRQISALLNEYISQVFPNSQDKDELVHPKNQKQPVNQFY